MHGVLVVSAVVLVACLAWSFTLIACAIRRDFRERFSRIQQGLADDAHTLMHDLLNDGRS